MNRIYKYNLEATDEQTLLMPLGARILCVQMQGPALCLWAEVDDAQTVEERRAFRVIGTGHPIPDAASLTYIGTVQMRGGQLIFHVYEKRLP